MQVRLEELTEVQPQTTNQELAFDEWDKGNHLVMAGCAGTGKTFLALHMALETVLDPDTPQDKVVVIRSTVPTREMGYLPGSKEEKEEVFTAPYKGLCENLFEDPAAWNKLRTTKKVEFESTSFIRGVTIDNAVIIVDEMQNLNFHELDSVITRVGLYSKMILCGDARQSDFKFEDEKEGIHKFLAIIEQMRKFSIVTFGWEDIVRSGFVRDYLMTKELLGF